MFVLRNGELDKVDAPHSAGHGGPGRTALLRSASRLFIGPTLRYSITSLNYGRMATEFSGWAESIASETVSIRSAR